MDAVTACAQRPRASELLLAHCAALDPAGRRPTARTRLESALGAEMARLLLLALSARRGYVG